jgi:hypothetical protein
MMMARSHGHYRTIKVLKGKRNRSLNLATAQAKDFRSRSIAGRRTTSVHAIPVVQQSRHEEECDQILVDYRQVGATYASNGTLPLNGHP